jgi:hypothetical protein
MKLRWMFVVADTCIQALRPMHRVRMLFLPASLVSVPRLDLSGSV